MKDELIVLARHLGESLKARGWMLATAESCTGGLLAAAVTEIAGSSEWFERGFVTYSNAAKMELLRVSADTLNNYGAVSEPTVLEMVSGTLATSANIDIAVAISGVAGPGGGTTLKPVGTVCIACGTRAGNTTAITSYFSGDRAAVREQATLVALEGLLNMCRA